MSTFQGESARLGDLRAPAGPPRQLREPKLVFLICVRASQRWRVPTPGSEAETPIPPSLLTVARLWSPSWSQSMSKVRPWSCPSSSRTALTSTLNISHQSVHVGRGWSRDTPATGLWRRCKHLESNQQPADNAGVPELDKMTTRGRPGWQWAGANTSHHVSHPPVLSGTALQRRRPMLHTISPHSGGCAGAAAQYGAVIGPAVGAASQPISPFLLLFAPRLAVTGCRVIGQELACPLRFTLMSLRVQSPILETPPRPPVWPRRSHSHLSARLRRHAGLICGPDEVKPSPRLK